MRSRRTLENSPAANAATISLEVQQLTCGSWQAGRMEVNVKGDSTWNLDFCNPAVAESNEESVASEGSRITST
jgi:hypothetical protein